MSAVVKLERVSHQQQPIPYTAEWVYATKELVDDLLFRNTRNRPIKKSFIDFISRVVLDGSWKPTPDAIAVSSSGVLLNGQNRLEGIKQAGYPPVPLLVVKNLPDQSMSAIDRGIGRSMRDILSLLLTDKISQRLTAALSWIDRVKKNMNSSGAYRPLPDHLIDLMENNQDVISVLLPLMNGQRAPAAAAILMYGQRDLAKARLFAEQVATGENLSVHSPAYALRRALGELKGGGTYVAQASYELTVSAILKHARGKSCTRLIRTADWSSFPKNSGP